MRLSQYLKIEIFETGANRSLESCVAVRDVVAILPTGFGKSLIYQVFCLVKLLTLNPNVGVLVILPFNSIDHVIEEQVRELTELGLSAFHLKD